jgi:hypothetical protein
MTPAQRLRAQVAGHDRDVVAPGLTVTVSIAPDRGAGVSG